MTGKLEKQRYIIIVPHGRYHLIYRLSANSGLQLFAALSETLNGQLRKVTIEKNDMIEQAEKMITTIRQMEASLDDSKAHRDYREFSQNPELQITLPLTRCLQVLKEKKTQITRLHQERFEQVKSMTPHPSRHLMRSVQVIANAIMTQNLLMPFYLILHTLNQAL